MKTKRVWWLFLTLFLAGGYRLSAADRLPNIIIIFTDDQGYGDLGCFGAKGFDTPNLDRLARLGRRFTNFHVAQPVCSASRAALLTGNYSNRIGIHGALGPNAKHGIADGETTLAELLKQKGYATGMAGKWHLGHHRRFLPIHHGFDEYLGLPYSNDMWPFHPEAKPGAYPPLPLIEGDRIIDPDVTALDQCRLTGMYTERAVSFINHHKNGPFFFYLAHSMPHVPLHVSDGYRGKSSQGLYGDVIQEIDAGVGTIVDALEENGLAQDTLVIFATDNGPWLSYGDHAGLAGAFREGKGTCWEGGVRVPCIMRWPGHVPANSTSNAMLMTIDLLPTIARLVGAPLPNHPIDGLDVWPLLSGEAGATNPHDAYVYYYEQNQLQAIVSGDGRWKLQLPHTYRTLAGHSGGHGGTPVKYEQTKIVQPELYDLASDLGETTDVAARHPDIVKRLLAVAERARDELGDSLTKREGRGIRPAGQIVAAAPAPATGISPAKWATAARERAEKLEAAGWTPTEARSISGKNGVISAIASPIAVQAGVEALKQGGTAADAATTVALTEVTTQLGSVVSYAGIMTLVYYDAKSGKVTSLDAGYNSYRNEADPNTIPGADMGPLNTTFQALRGKEVSGPTTAAANSKGRETLVPGFMAGIETMHARFGHLPFAELFEPAIWYAERGLIVNAPLSGFFKLRRDFLARTPEGRQFLHQAGNELPQTGDRFYQPELAKTLRAVAKHGSQYMYTGQWGQEFVKTIQREGGKVTIDDLARYRVDWSEPLATTFAAHKLYTAGPPSQSAYNMLPALNLAEELQLEKRLPYWKDPSALCDLQRISDVIENAPQLDPKIAAFLRGKSVDISPAAQLSKAYARAVAPLLGKLEVEPRAVPRHSNAVVVIDKEGSIAAITHTINSVIWGDTGIVVGGIPIPDSAGFQQARLAAIKPGDRLPNEMVQTIVFAGDKPILATAAIGSSMIPETIKLVLTIAGQGLDLETVQAAPPLMCNFMLGLPGQSVTDRGLVIPDEGYSAPFVKNLEAQGVKLTKIPTSTANALRGTVVAVKIDPETGLRHSVETPGILVFGGAE